VIVFFNTLTGKKEEFVPINPGEVKLYTCGPTVYDFAHVGNFRAYIFEDLLKRFLQFIGYKVVHIMNITDIDDKTIRGANAQGVSLAEYTRKYIDSFFSDLKTVNIAPADGYPRATEHIPEMVAIIKRLIQKGYAYEKENVHDFALWKAKKEGEPFWETEIGPGRPGWHIECSAMSSKYLGETFDIHCGGVDNIFPHHENEIAQSEAASGKKFVNFWLHCHHLIRDGEKMSKSKGNTITIPEILKIKNNPAALRLLLLSTHYRKTLNLTFEALNQAETALERINEFAGEVKYGLYPEGETTQFDQILGEAGQKFRAGLSDDLNISKAMTALFNLIKRANVLISKGKIKKGDAVKLDAFIESLNAVLAVIKPTRKSALEVQGAGKTAVSDKQPQEEVSPPPLKINAKEEVSVSAGVPRIEIEPTLSAEQLEKIRRRQKARAEKNFALADEIRRELLGQGILLEDTKDAVRWKAVPPPKKPT